MQWYLPSKTLIKYFAANHINKDVDTFAFSDLFYSFFHIFLVVVNCLKSAVTFHQLTFVRPTTYANHLQSLTDYHDIRVQLPDLKHRLHM